MHSSRNPRLAAILSLAAIAALASPHVSLATDLSDGLMYAVPAPAGKPVTIDGDLADWDRSATEPVYIAPQTIGKLNAEWSVMYDDEALYLGAIVALPDRPLSNRNKPQDPFWQGDLVQVRIATDPSLPYPLNGNRDAKNARVSHVSLWKDTETGEDFVHLGFGPQIDLGQVVNPKGTRVSIKVIDKTRYVVEARIPWTALNIADGRNPFKAGQRMTGVFEVLWTGGDATRVASVYKTNPGAFAFMQPQMWGQIEFAAKGFDKPLRPSIAEIAKSLAPAGGTVAEAPGRSFTVTVPAAGLKTSVNIFGENGEVIRELVGGQTLPAGENTLKWDGRDQWGRGVTPGTYRWGALFHRGLKAEYVGTVGTAGDPKFNTLDGKGGWGGDHSEPIDVAADAGGWYFLWPVGEASRPVVKTDFEGRVIWRKNPFVGGGFGPFYAIASDGEHVYLTLGDSKVRLVRLEAKTGQLLKWNGDGPTELPLYETKGTRVPPDSTPAGPAHGPHQDNDAAHLPLQPDAAGLAVHGAFLYVSSFSQHKVLVLDKATGKVLRELPVRGPRGLTVNTDGDVYVTSFEPGKSAAIVRFTRGEGAAQTVIDKELNAPYDVAIDAAGQVLVSDLGPSQQVKRYDPSGKLLGAIGRAGGRPWQGAYQDDALLRPAGIAYDGRGGLLVSESAIPKVFSRLDIATGRPTNQWFGPGVYWNSTWPMPNDPTSVFSTINGGLVRGRPVGAKEAWRPEAYFAPDRDGFPQATNLEHNMPQPQTLQGNNGQTYLMREANPRAIYVLDEAKKSLRPVATFDGKRDGSIELWIDNNADGQAQPDERRRVDKLADGKSIPPLAEMTAATHMRPNGDLYFISQSNSVLKLPAAELRADGTIRWNTDAMTTAIPQVLPGLKSLNTSWRHGILGVEVDKDGNFFTCFNARVEGNASTYDYPSPAAATSMLEGMGHTATFNAVKFGKYDSQGKPIWIAGRKATAGAAAGEMYHFWNLAGLVNGQYVAGASEWGRIYLYTSDGLYVDALMNDPADNPPPDPKTNSGETSGGRVVYFADRDEVWAYVNAMVFRVEGFKGGKLVDESRAEGRVQLDKVYDRPDIAGMSQPQPPLEIVRISADPITTPKAFEGIPRRTISVRGQEMADVQIAYDDGHLYVRARVTDATPLENDADEPALAFKGGDSVAIVLGPGEKRDGPVAGDVRILAAMIKGTPTLIGMRPIAINDKPENNRPFIYSTPAGGDARFADVGLVPKGRVSLEKVDGGYVVLMAIPRAYLGLPFGPDAKLSGDIELRTSGAGTRGLQTMGRHYLFTPPRPETTMLDDVPTESRLYPAYFGPLIVK